MAKAKVAILNDYQNVALKLADWSSVQEHADITVFTENFADEASVIEALRDFDVICVMRERTPLPRKVLAALPRLQLVASTARANSSIDMAAASELGKAVAWTDHLPYGTTEMTWGLILSAIRRIPWEVESVRSGGWQTTVGQDIYGRTLGIVGLGNFGKAVARVGKALGMNVIAWSQNLDPEVAREEGVTPVDKATLFRDSDIVTLHMVLSDRSRGLVGETELSQMKPTAWLINPSRGGLVDERAIVSTLRENRIAGLAMDAFAEEPLPQDHPFRSLRNVIATPHLGYVTEDTYRLFYGQTVENVAGWFRKEPVRTILPANFSTN